MKLSKTLALIFLTLNSTYANELIKYLKQVQDANPQLKANQELLYATKKERDLRRSSLLPKVDLIVSANKTKKAISLPSQTYSTNELLISQEIYNASSWNKYQEQKDKISLEKLRTISKNRNILLNSAYDYLDFTSINKQIDLYRSFRNTLQKQRQDMYSLYKSGDRSITDVRQTKVKLARHLFELSELEATRYELLLNLKEHCGNCEVNPKIKKVDIPSTESIISKQKNLELQIIEKEVSNEESKYNREKKTLLPEIDISYSLKNTHDKYWNDKINNLSNNTLSLNFKLNIFHSGKTHHSVKKAYHLMKAKKILSELNTNKQANKIKILKNKIEKSNEALQNLKWSLGMSLKTLQGLESEFKAGSRSAQDLLDGRKDLFTAKVDIIKEQSKQNKYKIELISLDNKLETIIKQ